VYLDEGITTVKQLADHLATTDKVSLCVQEVDQRESYDVTFCRGQGMK
jgi:hypothetical protein